MDTTYLKGSSRGDVLERIKNLEIELEDLEEGVRLTEHELDVLDLYLVELHKESVQVDKIVYCMQIIKFKKSGKFYDYWCLETDCKLMYQVVEDFEGFLHTEMYDYVITGNLCEQGNPSVVIGEHPNGYPCLIKGE